MCGIVGMISDSPVNQRLYDALMLLQHRGQDAAGIATLDGLTFHHHKAMGLVHEVFRTRDMRNLLGNAGIGHTRYPTAGCSSSSDEAQPFYVNAPYGIMFAHNGNLTNATALKQELYEQDHRHINTDSDSEVLLNVLADEISNLVIGSSLTPEKAFEAVRGVNRRIRGGYSCVALIAGKGLLAFRDPNGIRPLCFGTYVNERGFTEYMVASESVSLIGTGFTMAGDVAPGEAIFIDLQGNLYRAQCAENAKLSPCAFELVYFARPDSVMDGISVYGARLRLGEYLADDVARDIPLSEIDVVMPVPDSARPCAQQLAAKLNLSYREGLIKNRYVGRTFIMPGQAVRKKSVRQKLNAMPVEFKGKNVLLVDDSIVRGTTMGEIVALARSAGAKKVYVASSAPRVCFPNVYGIDMPTRSELLCGDGKSADEVARIIGANKVVYQSIEGMCKAFTDLNPEVTDFDCSCFDGRYVTGDIDEPYLQKLEVEKREAKERDKNRKAAEY